MALSKLSGDEQRIVFTQLCNVLDPRLAVALSSINNELRTATQEGRQQLRANHEAAAALCLKMGLRSCKELREAKEVWSLNKGLTADELALLGTLGSVLPALEVLRLCCEPAAGPDGVQRLAEGLGAGALPAVTYLILSAMPVGEPGASELAAALAPWAEAPCRGSRSSCWTALPSATWRWWWPSRRPCGGCPRWRLSVLVSTRSATRASPPSWRRRRQVCCRRRLECWRSSRRSSSTTPRSQTSDAPPSPPCSTTGRAAATRSIYSI